MTILAPTAATVSGSGRILSANVRGVSRARVALTDASGETKTVLTNQFGYYRFDQVAASETYIFEARHKGYQFAPQVLFVTEEAAELNFTAIAVRKILLLEESLSEK